MAKKSEARKELYNMGYSDKEIDYMWWYCQHKGHKVILRIPSIDSLNCKAAETLPREFKKMGGELNENNIKKWEILIMN